MVYKNDAVPWTLTFGWIAPENNQTISNMIQSIQKKKFDFLVVNLFSSSAQR